jgi:hypothetical protein
MQRTVSSARGIAHVLRTAAYMQAHTTHAQPAAGDWMALATPYYSSNSHTRTLLNIDVAALSVRLGYLVCNSGTVTRLDALPDFTDVLVCWCTTAACAGAVLRTLPWTGVTEDCSCRTDFTVDSFVQGSSVNGVFCKTTTLDVEAMYVH